LTLHVTFHHNLVENVASGAPRVRYGTVHVYNNVYDSVSGYAIASTQFAKLVVEANTFTNVKETTRIQHTSPNPGELVETGNVLSESGEMVTAGVAFKVSTYYTHTAQTAEEAEIAVRAGAGAGKIWLHP
jgi:pectate lyase